jgi:hypothetical protein
MPAGTIWIYPAANIRVALRSLTSRAGSAVPTIRIRTATGLRQYPRQRLPDLTRQSPKRPHRSRPRPRRGRAAWNLLGDRDGGREGGGHEEGMLGSFRRGPTGDASMAGRRPRSGEVPQGYPENAGLAPEFFRRTTSGWRRSGRSHRTPPEEEHRSCTKRRRSAGVRPSRC